MSAPRTWPGISNGEWLINSNTPQWFALLTDKQLRRGVHTSVYALEKDIRDWINLKISRWPEYAHDGC